MVHGKKSTDELVLSRLQVRQCDQVAIERFGIIGLVLMENAGSAAASYILGLLDGEPGKRVFIVAGVGNNAGDGFVVARHLSNAGVFVEVLICGSRERFKGDALSNLRIIEHMSLPISYIQSEQQDVEPFIAQRAEKADIIVDAMLGTGTSGPPRGVIRTAIKVLSDKKLSSKIVALDIPSGLDCDTGEPLEIAVRAGHTVTFAALKKGFRSLRAANYTGKVTVGSIGINMARPLAATKVKR